MRCKISPHNEKNKAISKAFAINSFFKSIKINHATIQQCNHATIQPCNNTTQIVLLLKTTKLVKLLPRIITPEIGTPPEVQLSFLVHC